MKHKGAQLCGLACAVIAAWPRGAVAADSCSEELRKALTASATVESRPVEATDLARLWDIAWPTTPGVSGLPRFALSPDASKIAFEVRRADPERNAHCVVLVLLSIDGVAPPAILDVHPEVVPSPRQGAGRLPFLNGSPAPQFIRWSPDGQHLLHLRRTAGVTQAWRLSIAPPGDAVQITHSLTDIEDVVWSEDGSAVIFRRQPERVAERQAQAREAKVGFLYDDRFAPKVGARPMLVNQTPEIVRHDLSSGRQTPADEDERAALDPRFLEGRPIQATTFAVADTGAKVWAERGDSADINSPSRLRASTPDGRNATCGEPQCLAVEDVWWGGDNSVTYLRREGWGRSQMAFYRWTPGDGPPRQGFVTDDALSGCIPVRALMLCAHEASTVPLRLVLINPDDGLQRILFEPNREFKRLQLGTVERLRWRNDLGLEIFGDLVLPPEHKTGDEHPLIIVQYSSRGFLRGGTGDEYPIQAFSGRGFAVLNLNRPQSVGSLTPARDVGAVEYAGRINWADRRSVHSALEEGIKLAIRRGVVDESRIGITGLSDGSVTVEYALANTDLFGAASISSCCLSPGTLIPLNGPLNGRRLQANGYPALGLEDREFWKPFSMVLNAKRVSTPLLMQLADTEYLGAVEVHAALKAFRRPVEMYVFEGEYHIKSQPAHRLAIYERNLDWFDFWLRGRTDPDPAKAGQYARWETLRAEASLSSLHADGRPIDPAS